MQSLFLEVYSKGLGITIIVIVVSILLIKLVSLLRKKDGRIRLSLLKLLEVDIEFQSSKSRKKK